MQGKESFVCLNYGHALNEKITPQVGGSMTDVKGPKGIEGHRWDPKPSTLKPKQQTNLTFYALGAMQPREIPKATLNSNTYSKPGKKMAKEGAETTELAWDSFPRVPPKFLG